MRLRGKTVLITGAGNGVGRASALLFATEGARIAAVDIDGAAAARVTDEIVQAGGDARAITADVARAQDCARMVAEAESAFGSVQVLFNNAGILDAADSGPEDTDEAVWQRTIAVNLTGVFHGCRYGLPALLRAGGGSVINMSSIVALIGSATAQIAYTAAKGGVLSMTREIAVIYAKRNIRANALLPGPLDTPLLMKVLDSEQKLARRRVHLPTGRFGAVEEIARAALFLASDESSYVTGAALVVDGGLSVAYVTPD